MWAGCIGGEQACVQRVESMNELTKRVITLNTDPGWRTPKPGPTEGRKWGERGLRVDGRKEGWSGGISWFGEKCADEEEGKDEWGVMNERLITGKGRRDGRRRVYDRWTGREGWRKDGGRGCECSWWFIREKIEEMSRWGGMDGVVEAKDETPGNQMEVWSRWQAHDGLLMAEGLRRGDIETMIGRRGDENRIISLWFQQEATNITSWYKRASPRRSPEKNVRRCMFADSIYRICARRIYLLAELNDLICPHSESDRTWNQWGEARRLNVSFSCWFETGQALTDV